MGNDFYVPKKVRDKIRERDKFCIYCGIELKDHPGIKGTKTDKATIEHMDGYSEKHPEEWNMAMCCGSCNSSRGPKSLTKWFETPYCKERNINRETVAKVVKNYISIIEKGGVPEYPQIP